MKLLFITGAYPNEIITELQQYSTLGVQNAPNTFQWAIIDGLVQNCVDFEVISCPFLPAYPIHFKKRRISNSPLLYYEKTVGEMLSYDNLFLFKTRSIQNSIQQSVAQWIKKNESTDEELIVLTYTPYYPFILALKQFQINNRVKVVSIVTDLVDDMMNFKTNRSILKRIQCWYEKKITKFSYRYIDKFVLLTKAMEERIPQSIGNNIVIEGIAALHDDLQIKKTNWPRSFVYTGTLESFSCVDRLVTAFMKIKDDNIKLIICGAGPLESMIKSAAEKDNRIDFRGLVSREESTLLQHNATILVNPRKPDGGITKYSFPSKTMEYLASGTPMIGYKLEGIPEDYYQYYFTVDSNEEESLIHTMKYAISLSQIELDKRAKNAYNFIKEYKNSRIQVKKILDYIEQND